MKARVFTCRVLRKIFGPKTDEVTDADEDCILRGYMICMPH
jgi:hypothetical protein